MSISNSADLPYITVKNSISINKTVDGDNELAIMWQVNHQFTYINKIDALIIIETLKNAFDIK